MRSFISVAALFVNVTARICQGATPCSIKYAMRWVSALVFPLPAPARINVGPCVCSTALRWGSFKPVRIESSVLGTRGS